MILKSFSGKTENPDTVWELEIKKVTAKFLAFDKTTGRLHLILQVVLPAFCLYKIFDTL